MLALVISKQTKSHLIKMHTSYFPKIVKQSIAEQQQALEFLKNSEPASRSMPPPKALKGFIQKLLAYETIYRIKIWGKDGCVLWANNQKIIGKCFPDNPEYEQAFSGNPAYLKAKPEKEENENLDTNEILLEIYSPVKSNGSVIGVVELYQKADTLFEDIKRQVGNIRLIVILGGLALYLLFLSLFIASQKKIRDSKDKLISTREGVIYALAYQAGLRDFETGRHLDRTAQFVAALTRELRKNPGLKTYINEQYIQDIFHAAPLHDIGKVGIPDSILLKEGPLSSEEWVTMKKHCEYGAEVLRKASERLPFKSFLDISINLAASHHERWDGGGYPAGLSGDAIPLSGRIMAVADVYDALRSRRPYKEPFDHEKAVSIIKEGRGTQFDPKVVDAFLQLEEKFIKISIECADEQSDLEKEKMRH